MSFLFYRPIDNPMAFLQLLLDDTSWWGGLGDSGAKATPLYGWQRQATAGSKCTKSIVEDPKEGQRLYLLLVIMNPYITNPGDIPAADKYADVPLFGRYFPRHDDFQVDPQHINSQSTASLQYWASVIELCSESVRIYPADEGHRDVFALGSVIVKSSHLHALANGEIKEIDFSYADANEVQAIAIAKNVLKDIRVPEIFFAGKVRAFSPSQLWHFHTHTVVDQWSSGADPRKDSGRYYGHRMAVPILHAVKPSDGRKTRSHVVEDPNILSNGRIHPVEGYILFSGINNDPDMAFMQNDFSISNLIVDNDRIVGLIDWEMAGFFGWQGAGAVHRRIRTPQREHFVNANLSEAMIQEIMYWNDLYDDGIPPDVDVVVYRHWGPPGVKRVIATGTSAFIGEVDDYTVLKYPLSPGGDMSQLEAERKLLEVVGPHPRIISLKSFSVVGLYLERAMNGTLADYLLESGNPTPSIYQRLSWCREAAEAVAHVHSKRVFHCDIQPTNILLDAKLHLKLSDFQGKLLSEDGEILIDGGSSEPCRFYLPRDNPFEAGIKTDIFGLGCTMYFIMMGHAVFPDIMDGEDGWHDKVVDRFAKQQFPQDSHICSSVTMKCWLQQYNSAEDIAQEIESIENNLLPEIKLSKT
ncbi:hypothetical protein V494_05801 [Pseudogymnoascus sp. VKM F-4513 (FW-928)]|nr:hypothetical protein V494_05801 [Pseudogymnoascus sp. VKM F-4513 (FW-928)]